MKLVKSNLDKQDILEQLKNTKLTIEVDLLELMFLVCSYGNETTDNSLKNTLSTLENWDARDIIMKELHLNSDNVGDLVKYNEMAELVQTELYKLNLVDQFYM